MIDFDGAWKLAIERLLPYLLGLVAPNLAELIDWEEAPVFLDNELPKLLGGGTSGKHIVDKLVKLKLRNGQTRILLIHLEVQNAPDPDFSGRIFRIYYRLLDRYGEEYEVTSLAILTDLDPNWRPGPYRQSTFGVELSFSFPYCKVLDLEPTLDQAIADGNPFALIVALHLSLMREQRRLNNPVEWKLRALMTAMRRCGRFYEAEIKTILKFIDWLVQLTPELDTQLKQALNENMKEDEMLYTGVLGLYIEEGRQEGRQEGLVSALSKIMAKKFGPLPAPYREKIEQASQENLEAWLENVVTSATPEEVFT